MSNPITTERAYKAAVGVCTAVIGFIAVEIWQDMRQTSATVALMQAQLAVIQSQISSKVDEYNRVSQERSQRIAALEHTTTEHGQRIAALEARR